MSRFLTKVFLFSWLLVLSIGTSYGNNGAKYKPIFANAKQADSLLRIPDTYIMGLGKFDIASKSRNIHATLQDKQNFTTQCIVEWSVTNIAKIQSVLDRIQTEVEKNGYHLPYPDTIYFIQSNMMDEGGAEGYTRGNSIILNQNIFIKPEQEFNNLILHELFHVLSRNNRTFRSNIYRIIGFELCNEIDLTPELKDHLISNPDAEHHHSFISITKDNKTIPYMMLLYSPKEYEGGSFFDYAQIGLVELEGKETKKLKLMDGKPIIKGFDDVPEFFDLVGKNTPYLLDPEEIMAENFVQSIFGETEAPNPEIHAAVRKVLQSQD